MSIVEKEKCVIARDGEGNIIPTEIILETHPDKPKVMMTPLTKGEFQQLVKVPDDEDELIRTHTKNPTFTKDEFEYIQPIMYGALKMALLSLTTSVSQIEIQTSTTKSLLDSAEAKKKSIMTKAN